MHGKLITAFMLIQNFRQNDGHICVMLEWDILIIKKFFLWLLPLKVNNNIYSGKISDNLYSFEDISST